MLDYLGYGVTLGTWFMDGRAPIEISCTTHNAAAKHNPPDTTIIAGSQGSLHSTGPNLGKQKVTITTEQGQASPRLRGSWFPDGFHGTMAELLCAIEDDREPTNSAADNLRSLALCFAAITSVETGRPVRPGRSKMLKPEWFSIRTVSFGRVR